MTDRILLVDDEKNLLDGLKRRFHRKFTIDVADNAKKGLQQLQSNVKYALVISDQQMPGMDGIAFLKEVMKTYPHTVRIMLTGKADKQNTIDSVNECQVFRYLSKPCSLDELANAINDGLVYHRSLISDFELLQKTMSGSVKLLIDILKINDPDHFIHISALRKMAQQFVTGMDTVNAWELDMAIMLSPIGNAALPPEISAKRIQGTSLNRIEQNLMTSAPKIAHDLLLNIPQMKAVADTIHYMDKAYDGSGFPFNTVKGRDIPIGSRIMFLLNHIVQQTDGKLPTDTDFAALEKNKHLFDPRLFQRAIETLQQVKQSEYIRLNVPITDLMQGDTLVEDLRTKAGDLALSAKNELTETLLQRVINFHKLHGLVEPISVVRKASSLG